MPVISPERTPQNTDTNNRNGPARCHLRARTCKRLVSHHQSGNATLAQTHLSWLPISNSLGNGFAERHRVVPRGRRLISFLSDLPGRISKQVDFTGTYGRVSDLKGIRAGTGTKCAATKLFFFSPTENRWRILHQCGNYRVKCTTWPRNTR